MLDSLLFLSTTSKTTTNTHAHIRTNPLSYSLSLLNNVSVEYIHIWLSISLLWNYNQLGIIMRREGRTRTRKLEWKADITKEQNETKTIKQSVTKPKKKR